MASLLGHKSRAGGHSRISQYPVLSPLRTPFSEISSAFPNQRPGLFSDDFDGTHELDPILNMFK
jgi:hypothetical protein